MQASAIIMAFAGFFLLYGGLAACIAIAWYHGKHPDKKESNR